MNFVRTVPVEGFTITSNATARDRRLSAEARGVLCYLLSHSEKFKMSNAQLQAEFNFKRDKCERILRELKTFGYLEITAVNADGGKFNGCEWTIYSDSQVEPDAGLTACGKKPHAGKTRMHLEDQSKKEKTVRKEEEEDAKKRRNGAAASNSKISTVIETEKETVTETNPTAINVYREIFSAFPAKKILKSQTERGQIKSDWEMVESVTNLTAWADVCEIWKQKGWNRLNVEGMLELYSRNISNGTQANTSPRKQTSTPQEEPVTASFETRAAFVDGLEAYERVKTNYLQQYPELTWEVQNYEQSYKFEF